MKRNKNLSSGPKHFKPNVKKASVARNNPIKTLTIDSWSADGRGVARDEGGVVFVTDALPGEQVEARIDNARSRFAEATVTNVLSSSPDRIEPACPHYNECGGCNAQHIAHLAQVGLKETAALEQLARLGGIQPENVLPPVISPPWGYRYRCRLSIWYETRKGQVTVQLGFRAKQSKAIVNIQQCDVLEPSLVTLLAPLRDWLQHHCSDSRAVSHVELLATPNKTVMVLRTIANIDASAEAALQRLMERYDLDCWLKPKKESSVLTDIHGEVRNTRYAYPLPNQDLEVGFGPLDFTQVNREVNTKMVDLALELLAPKPTDRVVDLFCGVGNFSLPLARLVREVIAIEADATMVERGKENALRNGLNNLSFVAEDLSDDKGQANWHKDGIDLALLDPPRMGAAQAIGYLLNLAPRALVYVSCNPATFARDAAVLVKGGYTMTHFGVLDMFPQTAHIEAIARFSR